MELYRRKGRNIHQVLYTEDLTEYHQNTGGVDWGNYLRDHGAGFSSKSNFKIGKNLGTYVCVVLVY